MNLIEEDYLRGRQAAEAEYAQGNRRMYFQIRGTWGKFFSDLMWQRYGVFVETFSCMTSDAQSSYREGYNSVVYEYVNSKDGPEAMEQLWGEVNQFRVEATRKFYDENPDLKRPKYFE